MIVNSHKLVHTKDAGNGYHGRCKHCGVALVTDLGYCSWEGLKCVDREAIHVSDLPDSIRPRVWSYLRFRSLEWNPKEGVFVKVYSEDTYTLNQIVEIVSKL